MEPDPDHPIVERPWQHDLSALHYHVGLDGSEPYLDLDLERNGIVRHLRFWSPQQLQIEDGFPRPTRGMVILDVSRRQLDGLAVWVTDREASSGKITFWAREVVDREGSGHASRTGPSRQDPIPLVIGGEEHERLVVQALGRSRPEAFGTEDGSWIDARVSVAAGAFRGEVSCSLRAEDFAALLSQVRRLAVQPKGTARFATVEGQLEFTITGDGQGHFEVRGSLWDAAGPGNRLVWSLAIDQTYLPGILASLSDIVSKCGT